MRTVPLLILVTLLAFPAAAVIIDSGDGTGNTSAPADDPGWDNVGTRGGTTVVYVDNGWVVTARHVGIGSVIFDGVLYDPVTDSRVIIEHNASKNADLAVFQLEEPWPPLPALEIRASESAVDDYVVMIGHGRDRGPATSWNPPPPDPTIYGYDWALPRTVRWGTNVVASVGEDIASGSDLTRSFSTDFTPISSGGTEHEAMAANGDSGGAVFVDDGVYWELGGVIYTIAQYDGQDADDALYGNLTYSADLSYYRDQILDIVYPCDNGIDDDGDGWVDHPDDPGCADADDPSELDPAVPCDDGLDNDDDGSSDFPDDPGCHYVTSVVEDPQCDDGFDNDHDDLIDWDGGGIGAPDPVCIDAPWQDFESPLSCGLGFELALLLPALLWWHRRRLARV